MESLGGLLSIRGLLVCIRVVVLNDDTVAQHDQRSARRWAREKRLVRQRGRFCTTWRSRGLRAATEHSGR